MADNILGFLNENSNAILAVFSIVVGITTIVYARITWRMFSETKKMREVQTEPNISVSIISKEDHSYFKDIEIQNVGLGPAYNIKFDVTSDFKYTEKKMFSEINIIKNGIKYLAPNQKIQFFLASISDIIQNKKEVSLKFIAKYENKFGKPHDGVFIIDFSEYFDMRHIGNPP